ncbi:MAG: LysM protein [Paenibacillaceae bacterium]|jgi:hypothetical protein|nr:LysM protein [Paenibacillaceae bacterium]
MYTTQPFLHCSSQSRDNRGARKIAAGIDSQYRKANRRFAGRKAIRLLLLLSVIAVSFLCGTLMNVYAFDQSVESDGAHTVYVGQGDTLWEIASQYKSDSQDIREYIYSIKKANHLTSSALQEGQTLRLP